jgi:TonB family protein
LFFGFYAVLLRKETFFQLNRIYLVAAALMSFLIPLMEAGWVNGLFVTRQLQTVIITYTSPVITITNSTPVAQSFSIGQIALGLYVGISIILSVKLIAQLVLVKRLIAKPDSLAAYSFFKKISVSSKLPGYDIIASHEQVHARQWHSADVLLIEVVAIINWFNPVVYLYKLAIKHIHEFIADSQVLQSGTTDKADYALLLFSQTFNTPSNQLVTPFYNHSLLKQRIMMIQKNRSQRIALLKYSFAVPLFALMLILSSATVSNFQKPAQKTPPKPTLKSRTLSKDAVYTVVEKLPTFPGGSKAFYTFLSTNIKYPAVDRENNNTGRVTIQFVVESDGRLTDIKSLRSPSQAMADEAIRVFKLSPKWNAGINNGKKVRSQFTVPVNFTLSKEG